MADPRADAADQFELIAGELERAAHHARVTACHYREHEIPRAGAHTTALLGHLENAKCMLSQRLKVAASFATNPLDNTD